ncbi:MAG: BON domain-containing protein [Acidobacteriaceae bacterium]
MLFSTGCHKQQAPTAQQSTPANDAQITTQVQGQIAAENALQGLPIQVQSVNGIVTLSGSVNDDAARELAANAAAQVAGVKTVVNNLVVQPERAAAPMPEQYRAPAPAPVHHTRHSHAAQPPAPPQQSADNNVPPPPPPSVPPAGNSMNNAMDQVQQVPPPPPTAPPQPVPQVLIIPAGTDIPVRISETLDTGKTQSNTPFHGVLSSDLIVNGLVAIPRGSNILGRVIESKDATHFKGNSELSLELTQVTAQRKQLTLITDPLVRQGQARGKNTAEKAGGGALLGTLIGALAGGGKGALIGALAGAGAGTAANTVTRGQQVNIPSETILHFQLKDPVQVTVMVTPGQGGQSY